MTEFIEDTALMLRYRDGDLAAFDVLYRRHNQALYRYLLRLCMNRDTAEDIYQEVWKKIISSRSRYQATAKFNTFLYRVAHNSFIDHARRNKRYSQPRTTILTAHIHDADDLTSLLKNFSETAAGRGLGSIPDEQRNAFLPRGRQSGPRAVRSLPESVAETVKAVCATQIAQAPGGIDGTVAMQETMHEMARNAHRTERTMSERQQFAGDDAIDQAVSNTYRAGATETVPVHLDRTVLAEARREAKGKSRASSLSAWLVPAAFAAVLALGLSFNLEFDQPDSIPAVPNQAGTEGNISAATALDSTDDLETAVESTGKRLRALDDAVSNLAPGNKPVSLPETSAVGDTGQSNSLAPYAAIVDGSCSKEATASAGTWWLCIESLQRNGQTDAARAELELLETAFPDFKLAR
jgi:RNA polymerase sigma-70 factor (ECF subfamily)